MGGLSTQKQKNYFAAFHGALEELYTVNGQLTTLSNETPPFDDSFYDAVVAELYGLGGYSPEYLTTPNGSALIQETANILNEGVSIGLREEDPAVRSALEQNTFIFSGFKTDQELREVSAMLRDENGNIKPFDQFKQEVLKINEKYNVNYLQAEYNMAVQSAQMASKWQDFMAHKDFVNLQYRTAGDEKVRAEHAALDGTTLPVEDKFWNEYLPPLGWNCRCTVVEVPKNTVPVSDSAEALNEMVAAGVPFRDCYKEVGHQVMEGKFRWDKPLRHTHIGSIGNLCNDRISENFYSTLKMFQFGKVAEAISSLVK